MPIKQAAKKALRQSISRQRVNDQKRVDYRKLVRATREFTAAQKTKKAQEQYVLASRALDKAAKVHVIHPNKAARLKSRLAKAIYSPKQEQLKK